MIKNRQRSIQRDDERTGCNRLEGVVRLFAREQGKPLSFRTYVSCVGPEWGIKGGFEDPSSSSARSELNLRGVYVDT